MRIGLPTLVVLLSSALAASGQVSVDVPDNLPAIGTCNTIPFGSANYTYIGRVPATFMNPYNPYVNEISFAPCSGGTWTAPIVIIALGHIPNPQPCPFNFPTFDASGTLTSLGSFNDLTIAYNSYLQGPFTWNLIADTWSPMGFAAVLGTTFIWNGTDDLAFFITFGSASSTGFGGTMHRTNTSPERSYASTFGAVASTACLSAAGLKMSFDVTTGPGAPPLTAWQVNQPASSLDVDGAPDAGPDQPMVAIKALGALGTLNLTSTNLGLPWDILLTTPEPGVSAFTGGIILPGPQVLNIDVTAPSLTIVFDLAFLLPFADASIPFAFPAPLSLSLQMLNVDPAQPVGFALSHLNQILVQ